MAKKKARKHKKSETTKSGRINRNNGIPADFMATSSKLSPRFPKVIMDESKSERGNASGTAVAATNPINLKMVNTSSPLPTRSSIYNQKNCITNTKSEIR